MAVAGWRLAVGAFRRCAHRRAQGRPGSADPPRCRPARRRRPAPRRALLELDRIARLHDRREQRRAGIDAAVLRGAAVRGAARGTTRPGAMVGHRHGRHRRGRHRLGRRRARPQRPLRRCPRPRRGPCSGLCTTSSAAGYARASGSRPVSSSSTALRRPCSCPPWSWLPGVHVSGHTTRDWLVLAALAAGPMMIGHTGYQLRPALCARVRGQPRDPRRARGRDADRVADPGHRGAAGAAGTARWRADPCRYRGRHAQGRGARRMRQETTTHPAMEGTRRMSSIPDQHESTRP